MDERRQYARLDTRAEVVYSIVPGTHKAKRTVTKNVSGGGICLLVDEELQPGTYLKITMKLPGSDQQVTFTGEVMWSESYEVIGRTQRRRAVEAGVRFVEITPEALDGLLQHAILMIRGQQPVL
jgi:c-di-GMP-binding flagellar brake protein YcgR